MNFKILLCAAALFVSCTSNRRIGDQDHSFNRDVKNIVWFQIAGLNEEHLSMLKFSSPNSTSESILEKFVCFGKVWNYNLYDLRPTSFNGFNSQILGSKNIKGQCQDYKTPAIWETTKFRNSLVGVLEVIADNKTQSMENALACSNQSNNWKNLALWKTGKVNGSGINSFHYQEPKRDLTPGVFFDKTCTKKGCFSSLLENIRFLYKNYKDKEQGNNLFIVRDFTYEDALINKNIVKSKEILKEFESAMKFIIQENAQNKNFLFVVSSSSAKGLELPSQGKKWVGYVKQGKNILYRRPQLLSPVFAYGAGAENFCGIYDEASVFNRILIDPNARQLKLNSVFSLF